MSETKVKCLKIDTFRRFGNITIPLGPNVTLIAGQNGTSKSTLLGMLAQPFSFGVVRGKTAGTPDQSSYTDNYHGVTLSKHIDLAGRHFMYDCDDVFRLSKQHDRDDKTYRYETVLENIAPAANSPLVDNTLFTRNRGRNTVKGVKGVRFVTGPGASHKSGEGNFPHPVIYLGLNRLWPLAATKKCDFPQNTLSPFDKEWYVQQYNKVLCLAEHDNSAKFMTTQEKKTFVTPANKNYDGESCSAGQDNLGQLLTAILSFRHLREKLGAKYRGGMLLIDELDATLHAVAQDELLQLLCKESEGLGLQVIATTHSLRMLEKAYQSSLRKQISVLYLANEDDAIVEKGFGTYEEVSSHLKVESPLPSKTAPPKVSVVFEDDEGSALFKQICGSKLRTYIHVANTSTMGAGHLKNLATLSRALPEVENLILVPDGDMANTWKDRPKNLIVLPGEKRPETLVYEHLRAKLDSDPFWRAIAPTYSKQVAIIRAGGDSQDKGEDKDWVKNWYKGQSAHWAHRKHKVFKSWVQANKPVCLSFCKEFVKLLRGRYRGTIPQAIVDKTLAPLKAP